MVQPLSIIGKVIIEVLQLLRGERSGRPVEEKANKLDGEKTDDGEP
jgi:hypothetical protein